MRAEGGGWEAGHRPVTSVCVVPGVPMINIQMVCFRHWALDSGGLNILVGVKGRVAPFCKRKHLTINKLNIQSVAEK